MIFAIFHITPIVALLLPCCVLLPANLALGCPSAASLRSGGWSDGRLVGWLVGRLVGWLVGWSVAWLVGRSFGRLVGWWVGRLVGGGPGLPPIMSNTLKETDEMEFGCGKQPNYFLTYSLADQPIHPVAVLSFPLSGGIL